LRKFQTASLILKMTASTGFMLVAYAGGALDGRYGQVVFVALALCWLGDLLLFFRGEGVFLAGLVSFLLAHLGLLYGFWLRGLSGGWCLGAVIVLVPVGVGIFRWLSPDIPKRMLGPVIAYMVVISTMVLLGVGAFGAGAGIIIPIGAATFYVSDIFVARDRFQGAEETNVVVGLPLYYTAVTLLALSVSHA
jgi:uncharacterized membrane protein YhhN